MTGEKVSIQQAPTAAPREARCDVQLDVHDSDNVEIMQSASILFRELTARGLSVKISPVAPTKTSATAATTEARVPESSVRASIRLSIGDQSLRSGLVDLSNEHSGQTKRINLEDAIDATMELISEARCV